MKPATMMRSATGDVVGCPENQYYDDNAGQCSMCAELCNLPMSFHDCARRCPGWTSARQLDASPSLEEADDSGLVPQPYILPIAATVSASVAVLLIAIVVLLLVYFFRHHSLSATGDDRVPFLRNGQAVSSTSDGQTSAQSSPRQPLHGADHHHGGHSSTSSESTQSGSDNQTHSLTISTESGDCDYQTLMHVAVVGDGIGGNFVCTSAAASLCALEASCSSGIVADASETNPCGDSSSNNDVEHGRRCSSNSGRPGTFEVTAVIENEQNLTSLSSCCSSSSSLARQPTMVSVSPIDSEVDDTEETNPKLAALASETPPVAADEVALSSMSVPPEGSVAEAEARSLMSGVRAIDIFARFEQRRRSIVRLVSFDIDSRIKMFGWLNSQPWVAQYSEEIDGIKIAVDNIDRDEAREKIRTAASRIISEFNFDIVEPVRGRYIACPRYMTKIPISNGAPTITPGNRIFSPRVEPAHVGATVQSGSALYSGSICGLSFPEYGLTVGHLFDKVGTACCHHPDDQGPTEVPIGVCAYKADIVDLTDSFRKTTADLALVQLTCRSNNVVVLGGRPYSIQMYRDVLDIQHVREVAILSVNGEIRHGLVTSTLFTNAKVGLFNTMAIVNPDQKNHTRINDQGDSGALVISVPDPTKNEVLVYGMVIGYFESEDASLSKTVATRLADVLDHLIPVGLDFPMPLPMDYTADGGFDDASGLDSGFASTMA